MKSSKLSNNIPLDNYSNLYRIDGSVMLVGSARS